MCIDVDEKPFALELVAYIQEDSIFGASGRENFAQSLSDYIQQIYADPLTNAYNRRYYTEHYLTGGGGNAAPVRRNRAGCRGSAVSSLPFFTQES